MDKNTQLVGNVGIICYVLKVKSENSSKVQKLYPRTYGVFLHPIVNVIGILHSNYSKNFEASGSP